MLVTVIDMTAVQVCHWFDCSVKHYYGNQVKEDDMDGALASTCKPEG
jgi:hypothetical protein